MLMLCVGITFNFQFPVFSSPVAAQEPVAVDPPGVKVVSVREEHSAGMGYLRHYNYTRMDMFKTEYLYRVNNGGATQLEGYQGYPTNNIYSLYNSYNRNFQLMVIITVGIYALNLVDAYVFGHLFDFQIDENLAMSLSPSVVPLPTGLHPTLGLTFSF